MKLKAVLAVLLALNIAFVSAQEAPKPANPQEQKQVSDLSAYFKDYLGEDASKEKFEFAVLSDVHVNGNEDHAKAFRALLERIKAVSTPAFVVIVGDLTDVGKKEHFAELFKIFKEVLGEKTKLIPTQGNHDKSMEGELDGLFGVRATGEALSGRYAIDYGKFHFIVFPCIWNGAKYPGDASNLAFLKADVEAHKDKPTLLFQHIGILSTIPNDSYLTNLGQERYDALELLQSLPSIKAVISGHTHTWFAARYFGKTYMSIGSTNAGSFLGMDWVNAWWLFKADGEKLETFVEVGNKKLIDVSDWEKKIPQFKTPMDDAEKKQGQTEIPLFTEKLAATPVIGNSADVTGAIDGVTPVAGTKMLVSTEKNKFPAADKLQFPPKSSFDAYFPLLTYGDFKVEKGDKLSYSIFIPTDCDAGPVGIVLPGVDFSKLKDSDGHPAIMDLKKEGLQGGKWLLREIPLGDLAGWFSGTQFIGPPSFKNTKPFKIFIDEIKLIKPGK